MTPPTLCREELPLPPVYCSKPAGHSGTHSSNMIPEPLSAVAADMVREHDRFLRLSEELDAERVRIRRISRRTAIVYATAGAVLTASGILQVIGLIG